jgi:predicted SprT family Zn-dependent metalloprotease
MDDDEDFTLNLSSVISNVFQSKKSESADDRRKLGVNVCCLEGDENAEEGEKVIMLDKENLFTPRKRQEGKTNAMTPRTGGKLAFTPVARKPFAEAAEAASLNSSQESTPTLSVRKSTKKKRQSLIAESPDETEEEAEVEEEASAEMDLSCESSPPAPDNDNGLEEIQPVYSARKGKRFSLLESPPSIGKAVASLDLQGVEEEEEEEEEEEMRKEFVATDANNNDGEDHVLVLEDNEVEDPSVDVETIEGSFENLSRAFRSNEGLRMLQRGLEHLRQGGYNPAEVFLDLLKVGAEHAPLPEQLLGSEQLTEEVIVNILSLCIENLGSIVNNNGRGQSPNPNPKPEQEEEEEEEGGNDFECAATAEGPAEQLSIESDDSSQVASEQTPMAEEEDLDSEEPLVVEASFKSDEEEQERVTGQQQEEEKSEITTEATTLMEVSANDDLGEKESCPETRDPEPAPSGESDDIILSTFGEEQVNEEEDLDIDERAPSCLEDSKNSGDEGEEAETEIRLPESQIKRLKNITVRSRSRRATTFHLDSDSDMDIAESPEQQAYQLPVWAESAANQMAQQDVEDVEIEDEKSPGGSVFVDCQARDRNAKAASHGEEDSKVVVASPPAALDLARPLHLARPSTSEDYLSADSQTPSTSGSHNEREEEGDSIEEEVTSGEVESKPTTDIHESWTNLGKDLRQKSRALLDSPASPLVIEVETNGREDEEAIGSHTPECEEVVSEDDDDDMSCSSGGSCIIMSTAKPKRSQLVIESESEDDDIFECEDDEDDEGRSPGKEMLFSHTDDGAAGFGGVKSDRSHLAMKRFQKEKEGLAKQLFSEFNERIFQNKLPSDMQVTWNASLNTTAGITKYSRRSGGLDGKVEYQASVELSSKVIDSQSRLRQTLCHELCHAGAWLIDHVARPPHGKVFKDWADKAMEKYPDLNVTTCHTYDIHYKFRWQCSNDWCGRVYGRHSNSINVKKQACGICSGKLNFMGKFNADGTPQKARAPSQFSLFVKEHYKSAKKECEKGTAGTADHATIMKHLSEKWNKKKELMNGKKNTTKPTRSNSGVKSLIAQFETFET